MYKSMHKPIHKRMGFTLLEVQLAMAALALGFSVITYAYIAVSQTSSHVYYRHWATQIIEQITQVLPRYSNHVGWLVAHSQMTPISTLSAHAPNHCFAGAICTEQAVLLAWWHTWQQTLSQQLPKGKLVLQCVSTCQAGHVLTLQITWQPPNRTLGALANQPVLAAQNVSPNHCLPQSCIQFDWPL